MAVIPATYGGPAGGHMGLASSLVYAPATTRNRHINTKCRSGGGARHRRDEAIDIGFFDAWHLALAQIQ
jgi:hypothetical protein